MNSLAILAAGRKSRIGAMIGLLAMITLSLSGCLYPEDEKQNVPPKEAVRNVQAAIDQYFDEQGLLPIVTSSQDVPVYEKYKIDYKKLQAKGYLSYIPSAAFENGGNYYFIIIDEETDPTVKLMDIATFQKLIDVQSWVKQYSDSRGSLPKKDEMYPGFYTIDYEGMGKKAPDIRSVFSGVGLHAILDDKGNIYVDYGIDLMQYIQKNGESATNGIDDLRELLVKSSDFVPVKAPVYKLVGGEPVAVLP
ncbi:DUF3939 domain-containing protein [Paenibacillus sp. 1011MAR3C5]|uniref:DUF3939 domain-containing protein n=1 Tax=Paenibacillus sp. 1011MAR3C5 TaxID=1675787 RepID=UPI000E6B6EA8|nr:DUF3939 domain-containing protein [Paenibacillus sp. 1011MAR3C5]RJE90033.1 DUF3939 domain-containing protein [Paenibacillus sp. 1011MAR3C5]